MFEREEVYNSTLKYFNGDAIATDVWINKYALKDSDGNLYEQNPDDMHLRLAKELARIEKKYPNPLTEEHIFSLLKDFKYIIPQGGSMAGIGNNRQIASLSNCFVVGEPKWDSYGAICKTDQELVQISKRRGGIGTDLTGLRPAKSAVNNSALNSTGIVPFAERYSNSIREVAQDGRRGALMLTLGIEHPDAEDFIDAKMKSGKITGANISVKVSDKFMKAVIDEKEFTQHFPVNSKTPTIIKTINAKKLWDKIINNAWASAEPGVLFWDKIINESPADCYANDGFSTVSTNPCVINYTPILTDKGYVTIKSVINQTINVWNGVEFTEVVPMITGKTNKWVTVYFSDGNKLKCTPYHNYHIKMGKYARSKTKKVQASALKVGDKLEKYTFPIIAGEKEGDLYTSGFYCGDGFTKRGEPAIDLHGIKKELIPYLKHRHSNGKKIIRIFLGREFGYNKTFVPNTEFSIKSRLSWLAGIIDSDGALNSPDGSIAVSSINRKFLMDIKFLLNTLGSTGVVSDMKDAEKKLMPNGHGGMSEYNCQKSYRIIISATNVKILSNLGLETHRVPIIANPNRNASRFVKVINIEEDIVENEYTYCFTEKKEGKGIFGGVLTGQCGELPLCINDSCRLLVLNLYSYVIAPFTNNAKFNNDLFKEHVVFAQRLMDDIIDLEIEKIKSIITKIKNDPEPHYIKKPELEVWVEIQKKAIAGRRTGLGITAEGDMLAALGLTYGTPEATIFAANVAKMLAVESYRSSAIMADERGVFPIYEKEKEKDNPFINRIKETSSDLTKLIETNGRRNIANLTIAPTGSVSICTQTTSGIEPVFRPIYKRRRKINPNDKNATIDFIDQSGDHWEEYLVVHNHFKTWMDVNNIDGNVEEMDEEELTTLISASPYHNATSEDINWKEKVIMQGEIQKWVDHSISVTVNVPKETSVEQVNDIYITAWESGCFPKGQTVYTKMGIVDISDIKKNDLVYGKDKKLHRVNKTFKLPKQKRILHHIKATGLEKVKATSEHPFYVIELDDLEYKKSWKNRKKAFKWKLAKDLKKGDHLVVPKDLEIDDHIDSIKITDYINIPHIVENGYVHLTRKLAWKKSVISKAPNSNPIPNIINIDDDFLKLLGWFIAEGHFSGNTELRLTLNKDKEEKIAIELSKIVENVFDISTVIENSKGNAIRLKFNSRILFLFFEKIVGHYSKNMHLPDFFIHLNKKKLHTLIHNYYLGDGGTTISKQLAKELFLSKILLDKKPYFKPNYGEGYYVNESTQNINLKTAKEHEGYLCYRINKNTYEIYNDYVYNLAIDDVDSYIVNGAIVHNCKGCTIYRDGSRTGVLIGKNEGKSLNTLIKENNAPRRPKNLECSITRFINDKEQWIGFLGMYADKETGEKFPYEIFTGLEESFPIPKYVNGGIIIKTKSDDGRNKYDLKYKDKDGYDINVSGLDRAFNKEFWNIGKFISAMLRHRLPMPMIINLVDTINLNGNNGHEIIFGTWQAGIKRILKRYLKEELTDELCPVCSSSNYITKEGCVTCLDCGHSVCG